MKAIKILFLLILLMSAEAVLSAESYLTDSTVWTFGYLQTNVTYPYITTKYGYILKGDTVLGGKLYHKVISPYGFYCVLREEGKKWYTRDRHYDNGEILLYDFSLGLGDSMQVSNSLGYTHYAIPVTKVDSVTFQNGIKRKRMELGYSYVWIEGIGDLSSLIGVIEPVPTCGMGCISTSKSMLLCFQQKGSVLFSDQTYCTTGCVYDVSKGLESLNRSKGLRWKLSGDGMLDYQMPEGAQLLKNAKLINLSGSTVWEARAGFEDGGGRIPVSHLPHGIYLLNVTTLGGVVVEKVSL